VANALGERVILDAPVGTIIQDERGARIESEAVAVSAQRVIVAVRITFYKVAGERAAGRAATCGGPSRFRALWTT
jgi:hypothetical protein